MFSLFSLIIRTVAWLAVPVVIICAIDDWVLKPARRLKVGGEPTAEATIIRFCYRWLPIVVAAVVLQIFISRSINFSLVLVIVTAATGLVWLIDALLLARRPERAVGNVVPATVEYARSIFPVAITVVLLRAFLFEPFRIPSDSMMPTLRDGDFIVVEKFAFGLRLPITHTKILNTGEPKRGDVVVFRPPFKLSQDWIKRVVGVPGDHVVVRNDRLTINGHRVPFKVTGIFSDGCYENMQIATEHLGTHVHQVLLCPVPLEFTQNPLPSCPRTDAHEYFCGGSPPPDALPLSEKSAFDMIVPPGDYMVMGDNRDNSYDSRFWGFVPEKDLVGKATYIWFNWDPHRAGGPIWSRIGTRIR